MTIGEFKAWFEGFTDGMGDAPTPEQWAKVRAKVSLLAHGPVAELARMPQGMFPQLIGAGTHGVIDPSRQAYGVLGKPGPDHKIQN